MINRHLLAVAIVTACVAAFGRSASATTQEQDLFILEGACYYTYNLPSLADSLPGVAIPKFRMLTTANYKGYRATWAVIDGQLFLIGVEGKTEETGGKRMLSTPELFPGVTFPVRATTFSGKIELEGRHLDYVIDDNSIITYTDTQTLTFANGRIADIKRSTHTEDLKKPVHERKSADQRMEDTR